jgi:putative DNA primase/helicase
MSDVGASEFIRAIEPVARELLGEPTQANSREIRFGTRGSLAINLADGTWFDHEAGEGGGVIDLVQNRKRTGKTGAIAWLQQRGHIPKAAPTKTARKRQVAAYDYTDEAGDLLFQVVRYEPKEFRQRAPDGIGWHWKMTGVRRVLYRLPEVIEAVAAGRIVYIVEGEKAANATAGLGVVATCSPGGANKWRPEYGNPLAGADVVILPDNDAPGRRHATAVASALRRTVRTVRILVLPDLPYKGDVADWIASGGTAIDLTRLTAAIGSNGQSAFDNTYSVVATYTNGHDDADLTDDGLITEGSVADAFSRAHRDDFRFDHDAGSWFMWTGACWQKERTRRAYRWAHELARQRAKDGGNDKAIVQAGRAAFAAGVERITQSDPALAVTSDVWDANPWLLGTPSGTIDLRTGDIRSAAQKDFIAKQTAVTPAAAPDCPLWDQFLLDATANDAALVRFLRQWCGYMLTGDTREHALLFIFGPGGNGKSVFLNTVAGILAEYGKVAAMETFVASQSDRHPTDLAMLKDARMVSASETEDGRAWAETRIKQLTGGDPISARFMRQDFFTFVPVFKLVVIGNHKPVLRNVDEAARRRFNVVPFVHTPSAPDRRLEMKLRAEWPGILRWMIEGGLDWQRHGLVRPQAVLDATAEYFSEQDSVRQWIEDCCDTGRNVSDTAANLFKSWTDYALANGEKPGSSKWFAQVLTRHGCEQVKRLPGSRTVRGWLRITVKPVDTSGQWQNRGERD